MAPTDEPVANLNHIPDDDDAPGPPISVPDSGDTGEGGKLKMIVQLLKKSLGVKDIAAMRLSLPASLLEPIPNLEYWHYLDRPDMFAAVNDNDEAFDRMLAVLRFTFTKDLKFVHGKPCKPYNSVLGEHFRAHWDIVPVESPTDFDLPPTAATHTSPPTPATIKATDPVSATLAAETASIRSARSSKSTRSGLSFASKPRKSPSTAATSPQQVPETNLNAQISNLNLGQEDGTDEGREGKLRVIYMTEQVSHHPPISAYYACCPSKSVELFGIDQIAAKVSGTTLRVAPGQYNQGIFLRINGGPGEGEQYQITHPIASVNGILRGSFYVTVGETTIITCTGGKPGHRFRAIIEYKEESWLGRAHFLLEAAIHTVLDTDTEQEQWTKIKHIPTSRLVAILEGSWKGQIRWKRAGTGMVATSSAASSPNPSHVRLPTSSIRSNAASKADLTRPADNDWVPLIDLSLLNVIPKAVRPMEKQLPFESRRLWESVTSRLVKKEFSDATKEKVVIEQKQRDEAAERRRKGVEFVPRYFEKDLEAGYSALTEEGRKAVEEELEEESSNHIVGSADAELEP